jgi:DNA/RNA-binding protein KIN17
LCIFSAWLLSPLFTATKWETLGAFVQYLGKTGLCRVDHDDKGWWVTYIDRDPRVLARQEELAKRAEQSRDEEERTAERLAKQVEEARTAEEAIKAAARAARGATGEDDDADAAAAAAAPELSRELGPRGEDEKIEFSLSGAPHAASSHAASAAAAASPATAASSGGIAAGPVAPKPFSLSLAKPSVFKAFAASSDSGEGSSSAAPVGSKRKGAPGSGASTLDALMAENERQKEQEQALKKLRSEPPAGAAAAAASSAPSSSSSSSKRLDYWLTPGIVVKVLNKKLLGGALYKQKGVVVRVVDRYVGEIKLLGPGAEGAPAGSVLRIDQAELETVLPALGKLVRVVNGAYRGEIAVLLELDERRYAASLRIESGLLRGKEVEGVDYEDICKLHEGS